MPVPIDVNDVPGSTIKSSRQLNPVNALFPIVLIVRGIYSLFTPPNALANAELLVDLKNDLLSA